MREWEFASPSRIVFGVGASSRLGELAAPLGRKALVVTGREVGRHAATLASLDAAGVTWESQAFESEPSVARLEQALAAARPRGFELVIGLGGGSALDAAKAIAALLTNEGPTLDYLEVVGRGRALERPALPILALPTTAGTGSEVTRNAVLQVGEQGVKVSLRSPHMLPRVAIVDPALTCSVPARVTADTGLDALTQVIEPFVSIAANPLTDAFCREGIRRSARSLRRAVAVGDDLDARSDLALASTFGGLALANAKLGAVHGFAGPIGGMVDAPHGAVCARLLPEVMATNVAYARERAGEDARAAEVLARHHEIARLLTGRDEADAEDGIAFVRSLVDELGVRPLADFGVRSEHVPRLVAAAQRSSSMKGNPFALPPETLAVLLERAL